jgi:hypothetical protein
MSVIERAMARINLEFLVMKKGSMWQFHIVDTFKEQFTVFSD